MPDLSMSTLNLVFAGLSITCAVLSAVMFVLARRAAQAEEQAPRPRRIEAPRTVKVQAKQRWVEAAEVDDEIEVDEVYHQLEDTAAYDVVDLTDDEWDDEEEWDDDPAAEAWDEEVVEVVDDQDEWVEAVPAPAASGGSRLPRGAEAALWAITEAVPDPRNHLVLKDPTSELRLHPVAAAGAGAAVAVAEPEIAPEPVPASTPEPEPTAEPALREGRMRSAIDETDVFTGEFFFAGEPKLNRF